MDFADAFPQPESGGSSRRARVISVSGRTLKVDLGGGIDIPCTDSCNPVPDQWVLIQVEGSSMIATDAIGGVYKQSVMVATSTNATTVTGVVNGVPLAVTKAGTFTVTPPQTLPLIWSADGSRVWVAGPEGAPTAPPPAGGGGTGGGGGVTSGTATYPASWAGSQSADWASGAVSVASNGSGFFYGGGRFRELQGRTITGFRVSLARERGSGSFNVYGHPHASAPSGVPTLGYSAGSRSAGAWVDLPIGLANYLIGGTGTGGLTFAGGSGMLLGLPYGTLQFDWRR